MMLLGRTILMRSLLRFFPSTLIPWIVWGIAVFYYLYEYVLRISPAVMVAEIMHSLQIDAAGMGSLSAVYFVVYGVMQIPVGILVDNYGPKRPLLCAALLITLGSFLFSYSHILLLSYISRGLIGFGSSFGYLCCLKLIVNWFQSKRFAFMCSLVNMVGMIGAFAGEITLSHLMSGFTWRQLLFSLSFVGILVVILLFLFVKNFPSKLPHNKGNIHTTKIFTNHPSLKRTFIKILTSKDVILSAIFVALIYCTFDTIAALWGTSYLEKTYHLNRNGAADISSLIFLGAIIGFPFIGWLTSHLQNWHKRLMMIAATIMFATAIAIWLAPSNLMLVRALFLLLGFCAGSTATATALAKESMPLEISGITMSVVNTSLVLIGAVSQPVFGYLLELGKQFHTTEVSLLSIADFHRAFFLMPCLYIIALFCAFFVKQPKEQAR